MSVSLNESTVPAYPDAQFSDRGLRFIDPDGQEQFIPWHLVHIRRMGAFWFWLCLYSENGKALRLGGSLAHVKVRRKLDEIEPHESQILKEQYLSDPANHYCVPSDNRKLHRQIRYAYLTIAGFLLSANLFFVAIYLRFTNQFDLDMTDIGHRLSRTLLGLVVLFALFSMYHVIKELFRLKRIRQALFVSSISNKGLSIYDADNNPSFLAWDELQLDPGQRLRTLNGTLVLGGNGWIQHSLIMRRFPSRPPTISIWRWIAWLLIACSVGPLFSFWVMYIKVEDQFQVDIGVIFGSVALLSWLMALGLYQYSHWIAKRTVPSSQ